VFSDGDGSDIWVVVILSQGNRDVWYWARISEHFQPFDQQDKPVLLVVIQPEV
jgi:hypothetical protein